MTKEQIFEIVKKNINIILPDIDIDSVKIEDSLKDDIGANSIDRMDILVQSMKDLGIKIQMVEFGKAKNIQGIVDILFANL